MTSKERFLTTINHKISDRVPLMDWILSQNIYKNILGKKLCNYDILEILKCSKFLGHDAIWVPMDPASEKEVDQNIFKDEEWGTFYKVTSEVSWPHKTPFDYSVRSPKDLNRIINPNPYNINKYKSIIELVKEIKIKNEDIAIIYGIPGILTHTLYILGLRRFCEWIYDYPKKILEILNLIYEYIKEVVQIVIKLGADAILIGDDMGHKSGLLFNPVFLISNYFPLLAKIVKITKEKNIPFILHSDGKIDLVLQEIVDAGIDALNPIENGVEGMEIEKLKKKFGKSICFIGNLNSKTILTMGNTEDIDKAVKNLIFNVGYCGGLVVASDHSLTDSMPFENILQIKIAVEKYGYYPLNIKL